MMGSRGRCIGGEFEAFSKGFRRLIRWRRGELKGIKTAFHQRLRRANRKADRIEARRAGDAADC